MVDYVKIHVKAGDGGDGHLSFRVQKGKPYGVADGGDGGPGGEVFIVASKDLNTLNPYRFKKNFDAPKGENGGRNNCTGAKSPDLILEVPLGTVRSRISRGITQLQKAMLGENPPDRHGREPRDKEEDCACECVH